MNISKNTSNNLSFQKLYYKHWSNQSNITDKQAEYLDKASTACKSNIYLSYNNLRPEQKDDPKNATIAFNINNEETGLSVYEKGGSKLGDVLCQIYANIIVDNDDVVHAAANSQKADSGMIEQSKKILDKFYAENPAETPFTDIGEDLLKSESGDL